MPCTPCFNPLTVILTLAHVWVCLPNMPLHFWDEPSLNAICSTLRKFLFVSRETELHNISSYAQICVKMDFSRGFPTKIILNSKNYSWTQHRACFETRHIAVHCPQGNRKDRKHHQKSTWRDGSHEDHQLITKSSRDSSTTQDLKPHYYDVYAQEIPSNQPNSIPRANVKDSNSLDLGKESQVHPSSHPLASHAYEVDKAVAVKKTKPPKQENTRMAGLAMAPLYVKEVWMVVGKKKKTPSTTQPMVTRSRTRNPT